MIFDIILVLLFIILFIISANITAYLKSRSISKKQTNSFYHINQNTPSGYKSSDGIASGYDKILSEDSNPFNDNSKEYEENILTRSFYEPEATDTPKTCLDGIDADHADGGGSWNSLSCGKWWKENMAGALMTFVGIAVQVMGVEENMKRSGIKDWNHTKTKMAQLDFKDADGKSIRSFNNMTPEDLNKVLDDPVNSNSASKFGDLCRDDPVFKKFADDRFKIIDVPKDTIPKELNDFYNKLDDDMKIKFKESLPGVDFDKLVDIPRPNVPVSFSVKEFSNVSPTLNLRRPNFDPKLSDIFESAAADAKRVELLDSMQKNGLKGIKSVDDVDFLSRLPDDLDGIKKIKIYNEFGLNIDSDVETIKTEMKNNMLEFKANKIYPSYQTFDPITSLPTGKGLQNLDDLKNRYEELFPPGPDSKPFRGTASIADMFESDKFDISKDLKMLKEKNIINPNLIPIKENGKIKLVTYELDNLRPPRVQLDVDMAFEKFDKMMENNNIRNKLNKKRAKELYKEMKELIDAKIPDIPKNKNLSRNPFDNMDLFPEKLKKLQKLGIIEMDYMREGKKLVKVRNNLDINPNAVGKKISIDTGGIGNMFDKKNLKELGKGMLPSVGIAGGLGVGMGLAGTNMYDSEERADFTFEMTTMLTGTVLAEVAEYVVERSLNTLLDAAS